MTSLQAFAVGLAATAFSCGGGSLNGSGTGGAAGTSTGGRGGADVTGTGGSTGTGGVPACDATPLPALLGQIFDGTAALTAPLTARVTVTSIDVEPPRVNLASTTTSQRWEWWRFIPNLPADLIKVGDTFDLTVDADETYSQTVVLSRGGQLVAFSVNLSGGTPALPALDRWGIVVSDAGPLCDALTSGDCGWRMHAARVTVGSVTETVAPGQTVTNQGLSFSVGDFRTVFDNGGECQQEPYTLMVGFWQR